MRRIALDILIIGVAVVTAWYVYTEYGETIGAFLFGDQTHTIYIESLALSVSVADEPAEREQGLSGVKELGELEGKLFIFDQPDIYGMWMKEMYIPLDIIWIDNDFEIIHIVENVTPDTYPQSFASAEPARFVLEVNAFFVDSFKVEVGDMVTIPASILPADLKEDLIEAADLQ